jgi:uncharacterized protein (UPF0332 family)
MVEPDGTFLTKASESLLGARAELAAGRYSNSANRSCYAVFQAAIHAILAEGIKRPDTADVWNHGWVQGQFNGLIINRRHRYGADLHSILGDNYKVRVRADYSRDAVSEAVAVRALRRAERLIGAIVQREQPS